MPGPQRDSTGNFDVSLGIGRSELHHPYNTVSGIDSTGSMRIGKGDRHKTVKRHECL